jgi:hypothetical protein
VETILFEKEIADIERAEAIKYGSSSNLAGEVFQQYGDALTTGYGAGLRNLCQSSNVFDWPSSTPSKFSFNLFN